MRAVARLFEKRKNEVQPHDKWTRVYFWIGLFLGLGTLGLPLIGVTVNVWLGAPLLAAAFACAVRAFWVWEGSLTLHGYFRVFTVILAGFVYFSLVGYQAVKEWKIERPAQGQARVRVLDVLPVLPSQSGAAFPALNIYYDNAGTGVARGIVSRFGAGFGNGQLSDERILAEQDKILQWDGWQSAMDRRKQHEMHPGDPGEFTSIPNMEGTLAQQFRSNWDKVSAGTSVLYVFITFKYFDPSGDIGVAENCFWFSGGLARHECGRGRTFIEHK